MKTFCSHLLFGLASAILFGATAGAQVLLDEDFSHGNVQDPPASSEWFMLANGGTGTATLTFPDETMLYTSIGTTTNLITYFTPAGAAVTLGIGQTMILSMELSMSNIASLADGLRFGLFYSGPGPAEATRITASVTDAFASPVFSQYDGYSVWFNPSATTAGDNIFERTGSGNFALFAAAVNTRLGADNPVSIGMTADTFADLSLAITRTSPTQLTLVSSVNGVELTRIDDSVDTFAFDTVAIQFATSVPGNAQTATIDNVRVTVVPEPSALGLAGMGAFGTAAFLCRRRTSQT